MLQCEALATELCGRICMMTRSLAHRNLDIYSPPLSSTIHAHKDYKAFSLLGKQNTALLQEYASLFSTFAAGIHV